MKIRTAARTDLSAITELYRILFSEMSGLQPRMWRPAMVPESFLSGLMEDEQSDILVAEEDGEVVGFAVMQAKATPPFSCIRPNRYGYLMDMAVLPPKRGLGYGSALLAEAERWCRSKGLLWLELNVLEENTDARRLYERVGLKPAQHLMRKMLD